MDKATRRLTELIERNGWALQSVMGDHYPWQVDFTYTVGNTAVGLPELLVVGVPPNVGGNLLNRLTELVRAGEIAPRAGTQVPGRLAGFDTPHSLRFGAVVDRWALQYGVMAYNLHLPAGGDPRDISFLQVVLPDVNGRFWDEAGYDHLAMDRLQPDLSEPVWPWRSPFVPWTDLHGPPPGDAVVLVPVLEPHRGETGRREAVPAEALGDDTYRLLRPPVMADWVTAGTEVRATGTAVTSLPNVPTGFVYREVTRTSPRAHLVWLVHAHDLFEHAAILGRVRPELDLPDTAWVDTPISLHVATPPRFAARLRSRLRHLVRDGLLVEREPYHRPVEPGLSCGPWCADYEGPLA